MSKNWVKDIHLMQGKYLTRQWVKDNPSKWKDFLAFRLDFLEEELTETVKAFAGNAQSIFISWIWLLAPRSTVKVTGLSISSNLLAQYVASLLSTAMEAPVPQNATGPIR